MMRQEMGLDGTEYESETGIESEGRLREHDETDDESVGSLDEFVVNDEQGPEARSAPRLTRRQIEWRFPRAQPSDSDGSSSDTLSSSMRDISSEREIDAHAPNYSSSNETDADTVSQLQGSRSVSRTGLPNDRSSETTGNNQMTLDESEDEVIASNARVRHRRRHRPNQMSATGRSAGHPTPSEVLQITSDSDESITQPRIRRRGAYEPGPDANENLRPMRNDIEGRAENTRRWTSQRNSRERQASRRSAARSRATRQRSILSNDTAENNGVIDDEHNRQHGLYRQSYERQISPPLSYDTDDALFIMGRETFSSDPLSPNYRSLEQRPLTNGTPQTLNSTISERRNNDLDSHSYLDPVTSVPVRRENINLLMPGAFPPSFVSEQGQSQSTPLVNFEDFTSPPLPHRSSANRQARYNQEHNQDFIERRNLEEQTTLAPHEEPSRRRERSAQKAARRQDRRRVKAEQEARDRRDGEPSAPPLMVL